MAKYGYEVLEKDSSSELAKKVESKLEDGWSLVGGVSACMAGWTTYYAQAMVKGD